jgi:hypothetical protein
VAGEQLIDRAASRLGNTRVQQRGRGDDQDGVGLGLTSGPWRQEQAEVAVGDRPGSSSSPCAFAPCCATGPAPAAGGMGYHAPPGPTIR